MARRASTISGNAPASERPQRERRSGTWPARANVVLAFRLMPCPAARFGAVQCRARQAQCRLPTRIWVYATVMLHEFLTSNRAELIDRCRAKVGRRSAPKATDDELTHGIPLFLDQLIKTLEVEQTLAPMRSREVSGASGGGGAPGEIGNAATIHGRELLQHGYTVDQVVHDYGDLCQAITDLAFELNVDIEIVEFRTLNRCLDNGIAGAVTEFNRQRDLITTDEHADALNQRLGVFAHELRNLLSTATLSLAAVRTGNVGLTGATGAMI
jgi:hypothetical protein